jgi:hypothetical protein
MCAPASGQRAARAHFCAPQAAAQDAAADAHARSLGARWHTHTHERTQAHVCYLSRAKRGCTRAASVSPNVCFRFRFHVHRANQMFGLYAALYAAAPVSVTPEAEAAFNAHMREASTRGSCARMHTR